MVISQRENRFVSNQSFKRGSTKFCLIYQRQHQRDDVPLPSPSVIHVSRKGEKNEETEA